MTTPTDSVPGLLGSTQSPDDSWRYRSRRWVGVELTNHLSLGRVADGHASGGPAANPASKAILGRFEAAGELPRRGRRRSVGMLGVLVAAVGWLIGSTTAVGAADAVGAVAPLRALLITGGCCHDYPRQKEILPQGISARARVEWTIVHDPRTGTSGKLDVYSRDDWAKGFDVVVHNECFSDEKEVPYLERILRPHREGVPAVVIHCAMHCYRAPSDEWFKFCGVTSHRHGSHFAYPMKVEKADHPIVLGMPETWKTPMEELYNIEKVWPSATPLASGYSHETQRNEVNVWINTYGRGRVFGTTLGHYNKTMEETWFLDIAARGLLWACGKLGDDGNPLPGYAPAAAR